MKVALVFPGQGAQKVGMGQDFYHAYEESATLYDHYPDIRDVCFFNKDEGLSSTLTTQQAILLTSVVMAKQVMKHVKVDAVAGLSLGEYSALVCAQALSIEEAMPLIQKRGQLMSDALVGHETGMSAIISDQIELIEDIVKKASEVGVCSIANYNAPAQFVISGELKALEVAKQQLVESGIRRVIPLKVAGAFHSSYLSDVSHDLRQALNQVNFLPTSIPVVMNVDAQASTQEFIPKLSKQIYSPVKWMQSLLMLESMGIDTIIEIGPSTTLSSMIKASCPNIKHKVVMDIDSLNQLIQEGL
jgi:[acyl-carrier-protein] S-malonyltransferase